MLSSAKRSSRFLSVLAALCMALSAQSPGTITKPDDYVARSKAMFRMLYPDLDPHLTAVFIDRQQLGDADSMSSFQVEFHNLRPKYGASEPRCWCSDPVLSAYVAFDWRTDKKELVIMSAIGRGASGKRDKFAEEMNRHPQWSDREVTAALNSAGARFGPDHKVEFLRALPIDELKRWVGEVEVGSAEFILRHSGGDGTPSEPALTWRVEARWHGPNGEDRPCILQFEPFDGRVTSIFRAP